MPRPSYQGWDDVYHAALRRGDDHGYAAHMADEWVKRHAARDELRALRLLRETCGMCCEQLPREVRDALHAVPDIEKTHACDLVPRR